MTTVRRAAVHILSAAGSACTTLCRKLPLNVVVRYWAVAPPTHAVRAKELVVIDLTDARPVLEPERVRSFLSRTTVCLVTGATPISPGWLDLARQPGVHVLQARCEEDIVRLIEGPNSRQLADLILDAEPALRPVNALVSAVCHDPWAIRRPRDLAVRCQIPLAVMKRRCVQLGFARVEHFIICVRLLAYEQLILADHMPINAARARAGFTDPSNMRRHARRAASRSPMVGRVLHQSA